MLIANPIFDTVFKYLMEDLPSAKLFLSTVIGENIEELQFSPQERTGRVASLGVTVFRLDFCAVISTPKGGRRQVLIELQKSNSGFDIRRFRRYLAENYHEASPSEVSGKTKAERDRDNPVLPILSIYLLGFPLTELKGHSALRIRRQYEDAVTGEVLEVRDDFIEKLTHDCFVLQLSEIHRRRRNKLERLLSIFEQMNIQANQHLKEYSELVPEEFALLVERLSQAALDEKLMREIEMEKEIMNSWLDQEKALELKVAEANRQKEEECRLKEEALEKEKEERRLKEKAQKDIEEAYYRLLKMGISPEQALGIVNLKEAPKATED